MKIESLKLTGFKSFADTTSFDFTKQFTAVVGPNGSGKSNVADGIRWVLGEQSLKLLRAKSSSDLIFGGSEKLGKLGVAHVELTLDNSDKMFPLDFEQIVISRKLFRDGENEYRVNGSKVRLQDIVMMIAQAKFGQKSYAVIGQGMITGFLNSTPQERKIFFDEATGVREYQIKRDQSINKLIRSEDHLVQSETVLAEIEPHLQSLERLVKRLEQRERVEADLRGVWTRFYGMQWAALSAEHADLKKREGMLAKEISAAEKTIEELQQKSDALAQESSRSERYSELQQQYNVLLEKKGQIVKNQAVLKAKVEVEHERQGQLSLVWLERKEDELRAQVRNAQETLRQLQAELTQQTAVEQRLSKQQKALERDIQEEESATKALREKITVNQHALSMDEVKVELDSLFAEQEAFLSALLATSTMGEFQKMQQTAKRIAKRFAAFMDTLNSDNREIVEELRVELKQKESILEKLVAEKRAIESQVQTTKITLAQIDSRTTIAREQQTSAEANLSDVEKQRATESAQNTNSRSEDVAAWNSQLQTFDTEITKTDKEMNAIRAHIDSFNQEEEAKKTALLAIQSDMRSANRSANNLTSERNTLEIRLAKIETRKEDIVAALNREVPQELHAAIFEYKAESHDNRGELEKQMIALTRKLEAIGTVDAETVNEYNATQERYTFLKDQITDLDKTITELEVVIDELDKTIHTQFQRNFKKINDSFHDFFKVLFDGGTAQLSLLTQEDIAESEVEATEAGTDAETAEAKREFLGRKKKKQKLVSGIDVVVNPPRKKITNIAALSGGEKSLVAVALLCAIIDNNPSPFVVLDEVEAALDEENSEKLAAILKELSKKTQIIIITHNRVTMRQADMLYGVTIGQEGKSHILSVELKDAEQLVEADTPVK